ncbi:MAG: multidrug effflux MFS transporter [Ilumatobacteraceae bacterium]
MFALLTAAMAVEAIGVDLLLPAFPDVRAAFGMPADSTEVSWIITVFFLGIALGPWVWGPLSDRFGRRRPLIAGLGLYCIGAALSALAPTWPLMLAARFVWGLGTGAPRSLSMAVIRDRHEGEAMARMMSTVVAVFLFVPIFAPLLSTGLRAIADWRIIFWFPAVAGALLAWWVVRLPETLPPERRRPFNGRAIVDAGAEILRQRETVSLMFSAMFVVGALLTYVGGSEIVIGEIYGLADWYPLFLGTIAAFGAVTSFVSGRIVVRMGLQRLIAAGMCVAVAAAGSLLVMSLIGGGRPPFVVFALLIAVIVPLCPGMLPNLNTAALGPVPHIAGTATAMMGTISTAGGAVLGGIGAAAFNGSTTPFAAVIFGYLMAATALARVATRRTV